MLGESSYPCQLDLSSIPRNYNGLVLLLLALWYYLMSNSVGLTTVSTLIGCGVEELKLALSARKMRVRNDDIVQKLTLSQVMIYYMACWKLVSCIWNGPFKKSFNNWSFCQFVRLLTQEMHWQNQFILVCLTGSLNK